ncbi:prepilin peptidase [Pelagovum sp. HNIBRBA483]|uniref:prepilin peptidase n=1 Tax=Pelagovum sp. HNIBRBA483 TaxID=3233341 RepID=UPI0034A17556
MSAGLTAAQALWFLPVVLPLSFYTAYTDLSTMKIRNHAVVALVIGFAVLGLFALPFEDYLWRWSHLAVVLVIGIGLNAIGAIGAGDAKFAAAAAPFIALADVRPLLYLFAGCLITGYLAHRLIRGSPLRKLAPEWESWSAGRRFPMGLPLGMTLSLYCLLPFLG